MGADIHMFIEYKVDDGDWQADPHHVMSDEDDGGYLLSVSAVGRNYEIFAALAGVRGPGPDPRGLPDDVSAVIKAESDRIDCDGHSHSWLSLDEYKKFIKKNKKTGNFADTDRKEAFYDWDAYSWDGKDGKPTRPPYWTTVANYCDDMENNIDWVIFDREVLGDKRKNRIEVRLVFWFDN
jgi:hypothetical protein